WLGRRAAYAGVEAARRMETRVEQLAAFDALAAYYGAVLASARVATLDTALGAAGETLRQVRLFRREGLVTLVDEQLAVGGTSEVGAARAMAGAGRIEATDRLLVLLGEQPGQAVELLDPLALTAAAPESGSRADLAALDAVLDAQQ